MTFVHVQHQNIKRVFLSLLRYPVKRLGNNANLLLVNMINLTYLYQQRKLEMVIFLIILKQNTNENVIHLKSANTIMLA